MIIWHFHLFILVMCGPVSIRLFNSVSLKDIFVLCVQFILALSILFYQCFNHLRFCSYIVIAKCFYQIALCDLFFYSHHFCQLCFNQKHFCLYSWHFCQLCFNQKHFCLYSWHFCQLCFYTSKPFLFLLKHVCRLCWSCVCCR